MAAIAASSFFSLLIVTVISISSVASDDRDFGAAVFSVKSKFFGKDRSLDVLKAHDSVRHLQILASGVDLPIGGSLLPDAVGLYYTKIGVGTPTREYYVQVDTGSDIMWINCIECQNCPNKGYNGLDLTLYNPNASFTGKLVTCDDKFCAVVNGGTVSGCKANASCFYSENYGDWSDSFGYFVKDVVLYDSVSGDLETMPANGSVIFGCGTIESGNLAFPTEAVDGILGFGKSNSSIISQLSSSGKVKKMFAHCLDANNGGGIFAIGHVVQPKVNSTHLNQDEPHYSVNVTRIEVGTELLNLSTHSLGRVKSIMTIIDSGTTLAYIPELIYQQLVKKVVAGQSGIILQILQNQFTCFKFSGSVDDGFPVVTFYFENSLSMKVYPHDYLFASEDFLCFGWQKNDIDPPSLRDTIILGELVLSNKLVLYDLESQTIGWTDYNCSSNITLKDEITGLVHVVGSHKLSSAYNLVIHKSVLIMLLLLALLNLLIP